MAATRNRILDDSGRLSPTCSDDLLYALPPAIPIDALTDIPTLLSTIHTPADLRRFNLDELKTVAEEIRYVLFRISECRNVHFASNFGVVELAIALHAMFDFTQDRLIWDTGHQCYSHKLLTGRLHQFQTLRTLGGIMGYPNPAESPYDLFMTGHAGCSVGSALGLTVGDLLLRPEENRHTFAVIGDGALASGPVFEAFNHAGWLRKNVTIILNDNKMSICNRVGGLSRYLDGLRMGHSYNRLKRGAHRFLDALPSGGTSTGNLLSHLKNGLKAGVLGGMLFEEFGLRYVGPIDGHDIPLLERYLKRAREYQEPTILHILTEKGHGFPAAECNPSRFHTPNPKKIHTIPSRFADPTLSVSLDDPAAVSMIDQPVANVEVPSKEPFTQWARNAIEKMMQEDFRFCVITAAMTQGNMLEPIREKYPDRFFDVGICEQHAVVFAAGLARAGMRPIVNIYSTFLQRAYDHIFQEVSLQNLPVIFMIDRAGIVGADGPTHHGVFDIAYLRPFPNLEVLAPGDPGEVEPMLRYAAAKDSPVAIRYPRQAILPFDRVRAEIHRGTSEILRPGKDGMIAVAGAFLEPAMEAAQEAEHFSTPVSVGVINSRFIKPLDRNALLDPLRQGKFLITAEDGILAGGFGSAVLEAASDDHLDTRRLHRIGIGDQYIEHGSREELLHLIGLDTEGFIQAIRLISGRK